jgi:hypothetical protein
MVKAKQARFVDWYTEKARPFLEQHAPEDVPRLDDQKKRAELLAAAPEEQAAACFLGSSGVGKSTLINAVVSERYNLLPHGGVGPLTAQATVVRYAETPYFRARYFPPKTLNRVLFALERFHEILTKRGTEASEELAKLLDEEDRREAESALPVEDGQGSGVSEKIEAYQRQARLLIQGNQTGPIDLPYLVDALRLSLGQKTRWDRTPNEDDLRRIERVRECLELASRDGVHRDREAGASMTDFLADLKEPASGSLAPLIKSLEVGWNGDALSEGLALVDLPGVGVATDEYRRVTTEWIREKARAIVLVVDRAGVTEASANLLRSTGFLTNLLHDTDDHASAVPITFAVVVVKVDLSADSAWEDEALHDEATARPWVEHFARLRTEVTEVVRNQMRQLLEKQVGAGAEATRDARRAAMDRIVQNMQVHAVSAPQFRLLHLKLQQKAARIEAAEESGIPQLIESLRRLARDQQMRSEARLAAAEEDLAAHVTAILKLKQAEWAQDVRAEREAQVLREELKRFLAPRKSELDQRQGGFREFLRESIPEQIRARVSESSLHARDDISEYLSGLAGLHWATLRALVRKGGAHLSPTAGHLDLPNELALRFEEPVAVVWSKHILGTLRKRTAALGEDYVSMVGEVVEWARSQEARVQPKVVEALHEKLAAETKDLASVGKEAINDLKTKVKSQLYERVQTKVRAHCEEFVEAKKDVGPGTKRRILEHLHQALATEIVEVARPVAERVLLANYNGVQREITERFAGYRNPLESARDAIVQSHESGVRRSDAQKRRRVLEEIDAIVAAKPRKRKAS